MLPSKSGILLCFACGFVGAGCDPVRTTTQPVQLRVVDAASGKAIASAAVRLNIDFERWPHDYPDTATPEEWHKHMRENWEQSPWFSGVTEKDGQATVEITYTALDWNGGNDVPQSRDWVTGKPYLVRVKRGQAPEEELAVLMKPGEFIKGQCYTVTVVEVHKPAYAQTEF